MADIVTVLVVGAGPTGLLLGAELRRHGVDCRILDAHERPMDWDRATVVHPRSLEIFEQLGIVEPLLAAGVRQRRARLHSDGAVLGEIDLALCGSRYPFNIGVSEEVTEAILTSYLADQGGAVLRSSRLVALDQRDDGVLATIDHQGTPVEVLARWVVGCDGYHSTVRTLSGIELDGHDIEEPWAVFDAAIAGWPESFESNYAYLDSLPVILTALPGERWRVYLRPSSPDSDLVEDAAGTLRRYLPDLRFEAVSNPTRFQCHAKIARRFRSGRILLAGDAAHTCSPAQGHGMNTGLQDAFNLAWKLALVSRGWRRETLLDSYEAERRPVAEAVAASGDAAESAQSVKETADRLVRDAAIRGVFADPEARHHEAVAEAELDIDYGGSPIVLGDPAKALRPGQRFPDRVEIRMAGGDEGTLGDLIDRAGHTALLVGSAATDLDELANLNRAVAAGADPAIVAAIVALTANADGNDAYHRLEPGAAEQLGVEALTLLVIRPDGHVGLRADDRHVEALARYGALLGSPLA